MLFRMEDLRRIAAGEITLAFRRWKRPTVKAGGTLTTPVGVLAIDAVDAVTLGGITAGEARKAGFAARDDLLRELRKRSAGTIYRIRLRPAGADPRIALRGRGTLTADELAELRAKLERMDRASADGPWTAKVLRLIERHPEVRAPDLAKRVKHDTPRFKRNVRKLKALGLTESLGIGYRLSPRGKAYLAAAANIGKRRAQ